MTLLITLVWLFGLPGFGIAPLADVCPQGERPVYEVVDLVPEIPEQPSRKQSNYTFFSRRLTVHYHEGQRALLSSTPDGAGPPTADDVIWLQAQPGLQVWEHDFRDPARTKVVPVAPQWVTHLFTPGVNELEVTLQDRTPPVYSSGPWFLLLVTCVPQPVTGVFTATQWLPTPVLATLTPVPTATVTATPPPSPTPTATSTPQPVAFLPLVQVSPPVETLAVAPRSRLPARHWALAGGVLVAGMALWRLQTRRRRYRLDGSVSIYQDGQYVRTVHLSELRKNPVTFGPHADVPLEIDPALGIATVQLRKQPGAAGQGELMVKYLAAADPDGSGQSSNHKLRVALTQKLAHGDAFTVGSYRLVYQHYA